MFKFSDDYDEGADNIDDGLGTGDGGGDVNSDDFGNDTEGTED